MSFSATFRPTTIYDTDLVDSDGRTADVEQPIGFGFFANDLVVVQSTLGIILVNAGGSDLGTTLSNLVVFDPTKGTVRQTVDLANLVPARPGLVDSSGTPVPPSGFRQSGAEALAFVPTSGTTGRLYVAMSNLIFSAPSYGAFKFPGTIQVFQVDLTAEKPIRAISDATFATETITLGGYNPGALSVATHGSSTHRVLVTVCGTT